MEDQLKSSFIQQPNPNAPLPPEKPKKKLWLKIILAIVGLIIILIGYGLIKNFIQNRQIANLEVTGSEEYKAYAKSVDEISNQWLSLKAEMESQGKSVDEINLAKKDFFNFIGSTILLKIGTESNLSQIEKTAIVRKLADLLKNDKDLIAAIVNPGCEYTEEDIRLQDFFASSTVKFKKPMIYIEGGDTETCSPKMSLAQYELWPKESWDSIIFDKSKIKEYPISATTSFTVLSRIKIKRGGLFADEREHYLLKDSNGVITAPSFSIFDSDFEGEIGDAGSELYQANKYIGHLVSDITSGAVWIQGTQVPKEAIEANTPKIATSFPDTISKRTEFMKRIMFAVDEGKFTYFTSKEIIDNDLGKDLYTYKNGEVIHNFGGRVSIKKNADTVSVIFEKIPKGEDCYEFYFINDPEIYGFEVTKIDGIQETYSETSSTAINNFKKKVCYSGNESVTIEFSGIISKIKEQAKFIRAMEKPRY